MYMGGIGNCDLQRTVRDFQHEHSRVVAKIEHRICREGGRKCTWHQYNIRWRVGRSKVRIGRDEPSQRSPNGLAGGLLYPGVLPGILIVLLVYWCVATARLLQLGRRLIARLRRESLRDAHYARFVSRAAEKLDPPRCTCVHWNPLQFLNCGVRESLYRRLRGRLGSFRPIGSLLLNHSWHFDPRGL